MIDMTNLLNNKLYIYIAMKTFMKEKSKHALLLQHLKVTTLFTDTTGQCPKLTCLQKKINVVNYCAVLINL